MIFHKLQIWTIFTTWISTEETTLGAQSDILDIRRSSDVITFVRGNWKLNVSSQLDSSMTALPWNQNRQLLDNLQNVQSKLLTLKLQIEFVLKIVIYHRINWWELMINTRLTTTINRSDIPGERIIIGSIRVHIWLIFEIIHLIT